MEIITENGFVVKIEDIKIGDKVLNSMGSLSSVTAIKKFSGKVISIKNFGTTDALQVNENYQVLTREYKTGKPIWKLANQLTANDYLAFPIKEYKNNSRGNKWSISRGNNCKIRLTIDYDLGYFVGLFLAEGHLRGKSITFACHEKELSQIKVFLEKFHHLCSSNWTYAQKSLTRTVTLYSDALSTFLKNYFFKNDDKFIPDSIFNKGRPFLEGLLRGLLDGDGSYVNPREIIFTTIRENFAIQMKKILISLRFGFPSIYELEAGYHYGRQCKKSYVLKLMGAGNWKLRKHYDFTLPLVNTWAGKFRVSKGRNPEGKKLWRRGKEHYWSKITSITEIKKNKLFFDLTLENASHGFCVLNGVISINTNDLH